MSPDHEGMNRAQHPIASTKQHFKYGHQVAHITRPVLCNGDIPHRARVLKILRIGQGQIEAQD